jgi:[acyl-carrier-protein] S-malonyltransferase
MKKHALVFPGQGSQRVGMLDTLPEHDDLVRLLDAAEALSGLELRRIAAEGPSDDLADTRAAQPLLFLTDWIWGASLMDAGLDPAIVAGHSLGEYAALALAGVFSVEAGLELVTERSQLMSETALATPGTMAAVLGMDAATVAALVADIAGVWVANDNSAGQLVLSGTYDGMVAATAALTTAGARRVVPLDVAGPFHSPLMAPAADRFALVLEHAGFDDARISVVQNTDPRPETGAALIKERLTRQITSPVRWTETVSALRDAGVEVIVEAGPGSVLTGLARRVEGIQAVAIDDGIEQVMEVLGA